MKIIVTGGAGFIGSAVCRHLVRETDAHVVNVDKLTYAANLRSLEPIANSPRYTFIRADICDRDAMDAVFARHAPDAVMHLAAESHVDRSIEGSDAFIRTNVLGTHCLLEAARAYWMRLPAERAQAFRFLHVSTDEVYGSLGPDGAFSEETAYDPSSPYSASKAAADHLAGAWFRTFGFPVVISNCSNNYGPYHFPEKLIPLVILNALEEKPLPVYGNGSNVRDWLYVEDHARALASDPHQGPASARNTTSAAATSAPTWRWSRRSATRSTGWCRRARAAAASSPSSPTAPATTTAMPSMPASSSASSAGAPRHDFDSGLAETVRWYLDNRAWWEPLRKGVYAGERLGLIAGTAKRRMRQAAMKILVAGAQGQLARALLGAGARARRLRRRGARAGRSSISWTKPRSPAPSTRCGRTLVVNAAAYTAVDKAESDAEAAFAINRDGAGGSGGCGPCRRLPDPARLDRLCIRRHQGRALCRDRSRQSLPVSTAAPSSKARRPSPPPIRAT